MSADAEVLIPHHRGRDSLRRTLESLRRQTTAVGVCVIDNSSADGSREMLATDFPEVRLVELAANRGFGAAVNEGARTSEAATIVITNNDVEADEHFCELLVAGVAEHGAAAGCLRVPDGTIDTAGVQADRSLVAYDHLHGEEYPPPAGVGSPLGPCGGAAAFAREVFGELGGFDEGFFAYLEDVDLAIRMRLAGIGCAGVPEAFGWHRHAGTLGAGSAAKNRLLGAGRGRLLWKYGGSLSAAQRARGLAVDAVTYAGQVAMDRNAGAIRGRVAERRRHAGERRPAAPALDGVPLLDVGLADSLKQRWARGRRYRGAAG